jgi:DNA-binding NarL/FixJ family response regulator
MTREELFANPPFALITRETRGIVEAINEQIAAQGRFSAQSTLLHKSHRPIPVMMYMTKIDRDGVDVLLTEFHDISVYKDTEEQLSLAQDRARNIMTLISEEKRQIVENIRGNIGLVALPLIDQLRTTATAEQQELLDVLENRVNHVTRRLGIGIDSGLPERSLTRRQILICEMIREGLTSKDIAQAMGCSPSTINNHRNTIRKKLGLTGKGANLQAYLNRAADPAEEPEPSLLDSMLDKLV